MDVSNTVPWHLKENIFKTISENIMLFCEQAPFSSCNLSHFIIIEMWIM